jgi:hypothetical protein
LTVHLIHGIHTAGFTPTLAGFLPLLKDWRYPDYGYIYGLETRTLNPVIVGTLKPYIAPDDVLICHSNGCAIAYDLMQQERMVVAGAIFINAALERDIERPAGCPWIDVYFNSGDEITQAAKIGAALGLTDPVWGEMGHAGYSGRDPLIANIDCGNTPGMPAVSGHSDFGTPEKFAKWGPFALARRGIS